jgi:hypothetical protein
MRRTLALVGIVSSIACSTPTTPTPAASPPPAAPATVTVSGSVTDVVDRRVANVRIEVISGPQTGTVTFSDDGGNFAFEPKLSPLSRIRASKQGYLENTEVIGGMATTVDLRFVLSSANAALNWNGTYDVTVTADPTCTELPEIARRRTYTASVTAGVNARLVFSGSRFGSFDGLDWSTMYFRQFDDYVQLYSQDPPVLELLPDNAFYMVYGGASGTVTREFAQLNVWGGISYCPQLRAGSSPSCDSPPITCVSSSHQMTMTRR